jgi:hypothetical protein
VIGPDPCDVGGIAELKWVGEYADLHGIAIAPHGTANGIFGLAALIPVSATLGDNFIAFEYPARFEPFWYEITEGFDGVLVKNGMIDVPDRPGLGVTLIPEAAKPHLSEEDADFFDEDAEIVLRNGAAATVRLGPQLTVVGRFVRMEQARDSGPVVVCIRAESIERAAVGTAG